jgi:glycosyltransferase involved in cell wall biosynthesis
MGFMDFLDEWQMLDVVTRQVLRLSLAGLKRFQCWITVSEFTRQSVIKHLGVDPNRVTTIYSGIELDRFKQVENPRTVLGNRYPASALDGAPLLLYVGSESPRKNFNLLLHVVSRLRSQFPDIKLIKVGSAGGEQFRKSTLQAIRSLGLEASVILFETIPEADLPLFYAAADIFVTASKLEGFGFPVLEAMACGTPVVCSDAGSLPEVGGEAAAFVKADDIDGWCSVICEIIDNYDRSREMVAMGLAQAQKFSWKAAAQQTAEVYKALAQST